MSWTLRPLLLQMVGHASQASKPGEYFTGTIADINYVVVRGSDNELRAFHNVRCLRLQGDLTSNLVKLSSKQILIDSLQTH